MKPVCSEELNGAGGVDGSCGPGRQVGVGGDGGRGIAAMAADCAAQVDESRGG